MSIFTEETLQSLTSWMLNHGLKILLIIAAVFVIKSVAQHFISTLVRRAIKHGIHSTAESDEKRENTVVAILNGIVLVALWSVAIIMIISEFGIEVGPIIAAAGIAGVALGFGSQYLIKDMIAGFFIIIENQYRVGDVVSMDATAGLVEEITLRMTTLRDLDGVVHHIPNGTPSVISNLTKDLSRVNLNIGIGYNVELEKAIKVINDVGKKLAKDPAWKDDIIETPQFLRVDDFADSAVIVKILGETQAGRQWDVTGELRMRLKIAFDKNGIEIPFPQRVIHSKNSD
jgi:small conductance mechanosensitive channel